MHSDNTLLSSKMRSYLRFPARMVLRKVNLRKINNEILSIYVFLWYPNSYDAWDLFFFVVLCVFFFSFCENSKLVFSNAYRHVYNKEEWCFMFFSFPKCLYKCLLFLLLPCNVHYSLCVTYFTDVHFVFFPRSTNRG